MGSYSRTDNISWIPCSSHKMQLCINKALSRTPTAQALVDKCHSISTSSRNSIAAMDILNQEQDKLQKRQHKLLSINATRWYSHFDMAARVLELADAITAAHCSMMRGSRDEKAKGVELGQFSL
ncbi:hypothetical protein BGX28_002297, partial [Mortierella sp. GBA30]